MKTKLFALSLMALMTVPSFAQSFTYVSVDDDVVEDNNRTGEGQIIRGAYLTNSFIQNWQITALGGAQTLLSKDNGSAIFTPRFDLMLTKWVTPTVGFRMGGFVGSLKEHHPGSPMYNHSQLRNDNGVNLFRHTFGANFDMLFHASNMGWGYKESRRLNFIPFISGEYIRLFESDNGDWFIKTKDDGTYYYDLSIAVAVGLSTQYHISKHFNLNFDVRDAVFSNSYHTRSAAAIGTQNLSASVGLTYNFGNKNRWLRIATATAPIARTAAEAVAERDRANDQNRQMSDQLEQTKSELEQAQNELAQRLTRDEFDNRVKNAKFIVYFDINSDKLASSESIRLDEYVKSVLESEPNHKFYLTGSADKGTGTQNINEKLSESRGRVIAEYLVKTLGVDGSQVIVKQPIVTDAHADGRIDRCVLFDNE